MSATIDYPLESIVRRVDQAAARKPLEPNERLVIHDGSRDQILPAPPLFSFGRRIDYFIVTTGLMTNMEVMAYDFRSPIRQIAVRALLAYAATCQPGNEGRVVKALAKGPNPTQALESRIIGWIRDFERDREADGIDFLDNFAELRDRLTRHIVMSARDAVGLRLQVQLSLEPEKKLDAVAVKSAPFTVRISDCEREISLTFKADLAVDPARRMAAVLRHAKIEGLEELMRNAIRRFMHREVTLHQACYRLKELARERLVPHLNEVLAPEGRAIEFFMIDPVETPPLPNEHLTIDPVVKCRIRDCAKPVPIGHHLRMTLEDLARFIAAQCGDPEEWMNRQIVRATENVLFGENYAALILNFQAEKIEELIKAEATRIGYSVQYYTVLPDLEPLTLRAEGFSIETEQRLITRDVRVKVGLGLIVSGRIPDLKRIEHYLKPQISIKAELEKHAVEVARKVLHATTPERFYMNFFSSEVDQSPTVDKELQEKIAERLQEYFGAEDIVVLPKMLESQLTDRFQQLRRGVREIVFDVYPLANSGRQVPVQFRLSYQIKAVHADGWSTFQDNAYATVDDETEEIGRILIEELRTYFELYPAEIAQYRHIQDRWKLQQSTGKAIEKVIRAFGLSIEIITLRRERTASEVAETNFHETRAKLRIDENDVLRKLTEVSHKKDLEDLQNSTRRA